MRTIFCLSLCLFAACSTTTGSVEIEQPLLIPAASAPQVAAPNAAAAQAEGGIKPIDCGWQKGGTLKAKLNFWPGLVGGNPIMNASAVNAVADSHAGIIRSYGFREMACAQAQGIQHAYGRIYGGKGNGDLEKRVAKTEGHLKRLTVAWAKDEQAAQQGQSAPAPAAASPTASPAPQPAPNASAAAPQSACDKIRNSDGFPSLAQGFEQLANETDGTAEPAKKAERGRIASAMKGFAAAPEGHSFPAQKNALISHCQ